MSYVILFFLDGEKYSIFIPIIWLIRDGASILTQFRHHEIDRIFGKQKGAASVADSLSFTAVRGSANLIRPRTMTAVAVLPLHDSIRRRCPR